jgi:hypothetical protein
MTSQLEQTVGTQERITLLLEELRDKVDLEQKARAMLLSQIADLTTKVDYLIESLVDNKPPQKLQSDAAIRNRERAWSG